MNNLNNKKKEKTEKCNWVCVTTLESKLRNIDGTCSDNDVCCCFKVSKFLSI